MNQTLVAAILVAAAVRPDAGQKAPAFSLEATTGKTVTLEQFHGRSVVLAFFPKAFTPG
jgi:peroxiredoxin Q/BCP